MSSGIRELTSRDFARAIPGRRFQPLGSAGTPRNDSPPGCTRISIGHSGSTHRRPFRSASPDRGGRSAIAPEILGCLSS